MYQLKLDFQILYSKIVPSLLQAESDFIDACSRDDEDSMYINFRMVELYKMKFDTDIKNFYWHLQKDHDFKCVTLDGLTHECRNVCLALKDIIHMMTNAFDAHKYTIARIKMVVSYHLRRLKSFLDTTSTWSSSLEDFDMYIDKEVTIV